MTPLEPGTELAGRYRVEEVLGRGGMGVVFRATDGTTGGAVAIKVLLPEHAQGRAGERFRNEAVAMKGLDHPNLVRLRDVGLHAGQVFLVLDLVEGGTAWELVLRGGRVAPRRAVDIVAGVLAGLAAAHVQGLVHRDVKPDNVLLDRDGTPRLGDFGIARVEGLDRSLTRTGAALGTWEYMAPEQRADSKTVDARADVFACGATLLSLLTGQRPRDLTSQEVRETLGEGLPDALAAIVRRATRYKPDDRYPSAAAMRDDLLATRARLPDVGPPSVHAPDVPLDAPTADLSAPSGSQGSLPAPVAAEPASRGALVLGAGAAGVMGVVVLGVVALTSMRPEPEGPPIHLDSTPPGSVLVDGVFRAATPWDSALLPRGTHRVELRLGDGRSHVVGEVDLSRPIAVCWDFDADAPCP